MSRRLASKRVHRIYLPHYQNKSDTTPISFELVQEVSKQGIWGYRHTRKYARDMGIKLAKAGNHHGAKQWREAYHRWD